MPEYIASKRRFNPPDREQTDHIRTFKKHVCFMRLVCSASNVVDVSIVVSCEGQIDFMTIMGNKQPAVTLNTFSI